MVYWQKQIRLTAERGNGMGKLRNMTAIYLLRGDQVLLLFRQGGRVVSDVWTGSAGGHFEPFELNDARACVLRELEEELGLCERDLQGLSMRYVTLRSTNGEIRQNYYFFAELNDTVPWDLRSNEGRVQWFPIDQTALLPMPFTAKYVLEHYRESGRFSRKQYVGVTDEDGVTFLELPMT